MRCSARRDRSRRADQAGQLDGADVDAQLQRRGRDDDAQVAFLQALLRAVPALAREAAVVRRDRVLAEPLAQVQRHALDQAPRVDEDQRRLVLARQRRDAVVELAPLLVGAHGAELVLGAPSPPDRGRGADRRRRSRAAGGRPTSRRAATSSGRTVADSPIRCEPSPGATSASSRSSDSARCAPRLSAATAWISSTITVRTSRSARRPDSDVSRMNSDSGVVTSTCGGCRAAWRRSRAVVSPVRTAVRTPGRRIAELRRQRPQLGERLLEVPADVVRQRLQRRHVEDARAVGQRAAGRDRLGDQAIERPQERRQGLSRSRRRRAQDVLAGGDQRPGLRLRGRRRAEPALEPGGDDRVKHPFSI